MRRDLLTPPCGQGGREWGADGESDGPACVRSRPGTGATYPRRRGGPGGSERPFRFRLQRIPTELFRIVKYNRELQTSALRRALEPNAETRVEDGEIALALPMMGECQGVATSFAG